MTNYLIITGGSRGIGAKTIDRFQQEGWETINISRTPYSNKKVTNIKADLSIPKQLNELKQPLQQALQDAKKICLVHNAAFYQRDCMDTMPIENLYHSLEINVIAPAVLNQIIIPFMPAGSSIIYIGTTLAEKAVPGSASYTISKHAMVGLMKTTCQDLIDKKIYTCCINPGLVDTQLLKETMTPDDIDYLLKNVIVGKRLIEPAEIANLIYFFSTTNVVNGVCVAANTGQVAD